MPPAAPGGEVLPTAGRSWWSHGVGAGEPVGFRGFVPAPLIYTASLASQVGLLR